MIQQACLVEPRFNPQTTFCDSSFDFEALDGRVSLVQRYFHSRCQLNVGRAQPARREQSCELEL